MKKKNCSAVNDDIVIGNKIDVSGKLAILEKSCIMGEHCGDSWAKSASYVDLAHWAEEDGDFYVFGIRPPEEVREDMADSYRDIPLGLDQGAYLYAWHSAAKKFWDNYLQELG